MKTPRLLWFAVPSAAGLALAVGLIASAPGPQRVETAERVTPVTVVRAEAKALRPTAQGFGNSRAARTWQAVAEVGGTVQTRHASLSGGSLIRAGTAVLELDPAPYRLALAEAEADLASQRAEAEQLAVEEENTTALLAIEQSRLALAEQELARTRSLVRQGTTAQARLDDQEKATLQVHRTVQEIQNSVSLVPSRRARLDAQIARSEARVSRAQRDLDHTVITTPFDLRVGEVLVEQHQFVTAGQRLITADAIDRAEVTAQVPLVDFQRLVGAVLGESTLAPLELMRQAEHMALEARVRLVGSSSVAWTGRVERVEAGLDPRSRTVQVVVAVDDPYGSIAPPDRLPLVSNMFLEVTLTAPPVPPAVVVPETAVRGGVVFVMSDEDRLDLRSVVVAFRQDGLAVLASGIEAGERVVLEDLIPALPGMKLQDVGETP